MATLSLTVPVMRVQRKEDGVMGFLVGGRFIAVTAEGGKPLPQAARPKIATQFLAVKGAFDSRTCARCWPYYETVWRSDDPKRPRYPMHIRCRCKLVPVTGPGQKLSKPGAYKDYLSQHPHIAQAILGKRRMEMLKSGAVKIDDLFDEDNRVILLKRLVAKPRRRVEAMKQPWQMTRAEFLTWKRANPLYAAMPKEGYTVLHISHELELPTIAELPEGEYLYHYTTIESLEQIAKRGLGAGRRSLGRGRTLEGEISNRVYAFTRSTPDIFENSIARDATGVADDEWAILRFKRPKDVKWLPDPEFKEPEDKGLAIYSKTILSPRRIDVLTPDGWVPLSDITIEEIPQHFAIVSQAQRQGKKIPRKVLKEYPELEKQRGIEKPYGKATK